MKYTIKDLRRDFPNEDACLDYIFRQKFDVKGYHKMKGRKCYAHQSTGHHIHPLAGTIFEKSSTSLTLWFHAIFLFSTSKNGVSAKELQRQLGVTYKCAWRIAHMIRKLMDQDNDLLTGTVEVDEAYYGKKYQKAAILGMVERKGSIKTTIVPRTSYWQLQGQIRANVKTGTSIMTDEFTSYRHINKHGYKHSTIKHGNKEYARGIVHTNTIEGFWGQFKRSIRGTHHFISKQHLQSYLDEFSFRYNLRDSSVPIFEVLLKRV